MMKFEELYDQAIEQIKKGNEPAAYHYLKDSMQDIEDNIKDIDDIPIRFTVNNNERSFLTYQQNGISTPVDINHLERVYFKSGEIAAKLGKDEDSLKHFQAYQKLVMYNFDGDKINGHLFSFRNFSEYSLYDLSKNAVSISRPRVMNDPFDTPLLEWGKYKLSQNKKPHTEHFVKSFNGYRIRSFSVPKDDNLPISNLLMWAHYANGHKGFCVEYDFSSDFRKPLRSFNHINYDRVDLSKDKLSITEAFATKSKDWEYENEVRLISYDCDSNDDHRTIFLDGKSSIVAVYLGLKCSKERASIIQTMLEGRSTKLYKMEAVGSAIPYELKPVLIE